MHLRPYPHPLAHPTRTRTHARARLRLTCVDRSFELEGDLEELSLPTSLTESIRLRLQTYVASTARTFGAGSRAPHDRDPSPSHAEPALAVRIEDTDPALHLLLQVTACLDGVFTLTLMKVRPYARGECGRAGRGWVHDTAVGAAGLGAAALGRAGCG